MKTSCPIAIVMPAALAAAAQLNCLSQPTVTITNRYTVFHPAHGPTDVSSTGSPTSPYTNTSASGSASLDDIQNSYAISSISEENGLTATQLTAENSVLISTTAPTTVALAATTTITITLTDTVSATSPGTLSITSPSEVGGSFATGNVGQQLMTIAILNKYGSQLSLSFGSNAGGPSPIGNPPATGLADNGFTQYAFPTGWAGRIGLGPNLNPDSSKIEGSYTGPPDIDVSYVDGYTVPITCSSQGTAVSGCNIDLFNQSGVPCGKQVDGPVCLNSAQNVADGPAPAFFAACAGAAYTYPKDDLANQGGLNSTLVNCCVGTSCEAPARQINVERKQGQPWKIRAAKRSVSAPQRLFKRQHRHPWRLLTGL